MWKTEDLVKASRQSQQSLFLPGALLLGAVAVAACSSSQNDSGPPDADGADVARTDIPSSDTPAVEDISAEVKQTCAERGEASCTTSAGCFSIRGVPFGDLCEGRATMTFAGCVSGGPDGGMMITWARQQATGRIFQFPTTQVPPGWARIAEPVCPSNGGADTTFDSAGSVDAGTCKGEDTDLEELAACQ